MLVGFARRSPLVALITALCLTAPAALRAQSPPAAVPSAPTLQGAAFGQTVALTWTAVPGATSYVVGVGVQSNSYLLVQNVGNVNAVSVAAPPGVYFVRMVAQNAEGISPPSNEVVIAVAPSSGAPPAAPGGLAAQVAGLTAYLSWQLGQGGGPMTGLVFAIGSSPGASNLALIPLQVSTQATATVPPGSYFTRLHAVGPGGVSAASNEIFVTIGVTGCGVPGAPTLSANVSGTTVALSWTPIGGVAGYRLEVSMTAGGPLVLSQGVDAATTSLSAPGVAAGTYYAKVTAITPCGTEATGPEIALTVTAPVGGNRTPDPAPGRILPLPDMSDIVDEVARSYPNDLRNSCREHGGNNTWLFRLVQRLRQFDTRWGLNWKRANRGDMSQDVVNYHYSAGPDEDSFDTYVVDVIGGHCGPNPGPAFQDVTVLGTRGAIWTLRPFINAGFQP